MKKKLKNKEQNVKNIKKSRSVKWMRKKVLTKEKLKKKKIRKKMQTFFSVPINNKKKQFIV